MTGLSRRFWLAASLILLAVAAPCGAWYVGGSRSADREARQIQQRVIDRGHQVALGLAERLRGRLEAMADGESLRPFYHFHPTFHDPTSTCECRSESPSPLATGPGDPFIARYFQIDPYGRVTVPSVTSAHDPLPREEELRAAAGECLEAVEANVQPQALAASRSLLPLAELAPADSSAGLLMDLLASDPWLQVETFQWHTIPLAQRPTLVALRRVQSTRAPLVQGFVLSQPAVEGWLEAAELPASLRPSTDLENADDVVTAGIPLECTRWEVAVRMGDQLEDARARGRELRAGFRRDFALGSGAATVAALAVIFVLALTERSGRQRSRFAASAAHELRTPLAGLRLYGDMLAEEDLDPERRRRYAERISGEAERLGRVVTNVLGFTHLERGELRADPRPGDLAATVAEILERLRAPMATTGLDLRFTAPDGPVGAGFDAEAVETIVRNLVDNAEKYSRASDDRRVEVEVLSRGEEVELRVSDHGPGVDPAVGDRLFEAFSRGRAEGVPAGLGLGLMLVRALAEAQGARVRWKNLEGGGARFTVIFPAAEATPGPVERSRDSAADRRTLN